MAEQWYSVWAVPPEDVRARLASLVDALRSEFGGPRFDPHITLSGLVKLVPADAVQRFKASCNNCGVKPFKARFIAVSRGSIFFQCVYLLVEPKPELVDASVRSSSYMGFNSTTEYMPHLSLLYGDLSEETKEKAIEKVKTLDQTLVDFEFEVSEFALYHTELGGAVESWEKVASCDLNKGCC